MRGRRSKGTHKLETIRIDGVTEEIDIYIDLSDGTFYARMEKNNDKKTTSKSLNDLREKVQSALSSRGILSWTPVIEIRTDGTRGAGTGKEKGALALQYDRFYVAKRGDGEYMSSKWDHSPEERTKHAHNFRVFWGHEYVEISLPMHLKPRTGKEPGNLYNEMGHFHLLPYSEQLWLGLEDLATRVDELGRRIETMLNSERGRLRLATGGRLLLNPAKEDLVTI